MEGNDFEPFSKHAVPAVLALPLTEVMCHVVCTSHL